MNRNFQYVKEQCSTCGGSGRLSMKHQRGFYTCTQQRRRLPSCGDCLGSGYHEIRKKRLDADWDVKMGSDR